MNSNLITWVAVAIVCGYYAIAWFMVGRDPKPGIIVTYYQPPRGLSPSMLRFVWKETFDDRTFWAGVLSLVAKGLAILGTEDDVTLVRPTATAKDRPALPKEEQFLLDKVLHPCGQKGVPMNMLDDETAYAASQMASALRQAAVGRWFLENRETVISGAVLSFIPVYFSTKPQSMDQWLALGLGLAAMAPGAFYLIFVVLRFADLDKRMRDGEPEQTTERHMRWMKSCDHLTAVLLVMAVIHAITIGST